MHTRLPRLLALVAGLAALSLPTVAFAQESTTTLTATLTERRRSLVRATPTALAPPPSPAAGPGLLQHDLGQHWRRHPSPHPQGCTGVAGPIVVTLFDVADRCHPGRTPRRVADAEAAVIDAIRQNPAGYYVNVHTPNCPRARSVAAAGLLAAAVHR